MKNTLGDLNNHLFAQLEKLGDDDLTGEELESELRELMLYATLVSRSSKMENCSTRR